LLEGDPVPGILKAVKHHKADLLILGTHGSKNLNRLLLGSTADEVLRKASCPVLTVGPNIHDPKRGDSLFSKIVLATDLNPKAAAAVAHAFSLVAEQATHVSICHVIPEGDTKTADTALLQRELMHAVKKLIPEDIRNKCEAEYIVEYGNASDEILEHAEKQNADLIILGAHPASAVVTHLAPGIAFRVILGAACPVLTIHI
jgi:nucleotide-binding universal stress UspA family protein